MRDHCDIARRYPRQHVSHRRHNPDLSVNRAFPAAHAFFRTGEEGVRQGLKCRFWQIAGGGAVVFSEAGTGDWCQTEKRGENVSAVDRDVGMGDEKDRPQQLTGSQRDPAATIAAFSAFIPAAGPSG